MEGEGCEDCEDYEGCESCEGCEGLSPFKFSGLDLKSVQKFFLLRSETKGNGTGVTLFTFA